MDETNWSSDFYSDIFSLGFDSLFNAIDLESLESKENSDTVPEVLNTTNRTNQSFFLLWNLLLTLIIVPRLRFSHFVIGTINW